MQAVQLGSTILRFFHHQAYCNESEMGLRATHHASGWSYRQSIRWSRIPQCHLLPQLQLEGQVVGH